MQIKFHKQPISFLEKSSEKEKSKIKFKLKELYDFYSGNGWHHLSELDIKTLDGNWKGYRRLRIGKIRIIYQLDRTDDTLIIVKIDSRGDVYK